MGNLLAHTSGFLKILKSSVLKSRDGIRRRCQRKPERRESFIGQTSGTARRDEKLRFDHPRVRATAGRSQSRGAPRWRELCADQKQLTVKKTKL